MNASPIKQNAILLKNVSREIQKLHSEILFVKCELKCIKDILNKNDDMDIVKIKDNPHNPPYPQQSQVAVEKGWFW